MKKFLVIVSLLAASAVWAGEPVYTASPENLKSRQEFSQARFGIFIHWGIYSMLGDGEWVQNNKGIPFDEYSKLAGGFYPSRFNAQEWVNVFKEAGAKYVTFTSRHHDGFSMFKSEASDYNVVDKTPFHRDVVGELSKAVTDAGLRMHFYYSHLDWGRSDYTLRGGTGKMPRDGRTGDWNDYLKFVNAQLTELLTKYGPIGCIWFDGAWDKMNPDRAVWGKDYNFDEQYALIHKLQPGCLVGNNHHKTPWPGEDIQLFERDVPGQNSAGLSGQEIEGSLPLETCQTINGPWGYKIVNNKSKPLKELIQLLAKTAAMDANLLLNIGPRPDGTLPDDAVERLLEMGKWLKVNGESIYATRGGLTKAQDWGVTTFKDNKLYIHLFNTDSEISFPVGVKQNKILSVKALDDGKDVVFKQDKTGFTVTPEALGDVIDKVLVVTFKKDIDRALFATAE